MAQTHNAPATNGSNAADLIILQIASTDSDRGFYYMVSIPGDAAHKAAVADNLTVRGRTVAKNAIKDGKPERDTVQAFLDKELASGIAADKFNVNSLANFVTKNDAARAHVTARLTSAGVANVTDAHLTHAKTLDWASRNLGAVLNAGYAVSKRGSGKPETATSDAAADLAGLNL